MTTRFIENLKVGGGAGAPAVGNSPAGGCTIANNGDITTDGAFSPASLAVGGGYGSTGATISSAGAGQFNGALTTDGALTADSAVIGGGYGATGATISNAGVIQANGTAQVDGTLTLGKATDAGEIVLTGSTSGTATITTDATAATVLANKTVEVQGVNVPGVIVASNSSTAIVAGNALGHVQFKTYDSSTNASGLTAQISSYADELFGGSPYVPSSLRTFVRNYASPTALIEFMRMSSSVAGSITSFLEGLIKIGIAGGTNSASVTMVGKTSGSNVIDVTDTAGSIRIGSTPATNSTQFDTTGHQTMIGTAKPWEDLRVEPIARTTGTNAPTFEKYLDDAAGTSRGVYAYSFDDAAAGSEKEVFFNMQLPHAWDSGAIGIHVHWIGAVADTTAAPRWGLEYAWKEIGGTFGDTATIYTVDKIPAEADVVALKHYISDFASLTPDTTQDGLSSILMCRLFRNSSDAADTYNAAGAKCGLLAIDAHYQLNSLGSTDEYTK